MDQFKVLVPAVMTAFSLIGAPALADVSPAEALHSSLHRTEHLIDLHEVDGAFIKDFKGGEVVVVSPQAATDPSFKATLSQAPGHDGNSTSIVYLLNGQGKEISHSVNSGSTAENPPHFPGVDPITLTEYAFHYLIANGNPAKAGVKADLVPYFTQLKSVSIEVGTNASGQTAGIVSFNGAFIKQTLKIVVNLDTNVESYTIQ